MLSQGLMTTRLTSAVAMCNGCDLNSMLHSNARLQNVELSQLCIITGCSNAGIKFSQVPMLRFSSRRSDSFTDYRKI